MSSKLFTSANVKRGIVESEFTKEFTEKPDRSGLVLFVGLVLVILIGLFIFKNWDTTSLLLSAGVVKSGLQKSNDEESPFGIVFVVLVIVTLVFGFCLLPIQ